jgi:hypothetical protein
MKRSTIQRINEASANIISWSGYTKENDELIEWCDNEVPQHAVAIKREWRGLPDVAFHFAMQSEAHTLFLALCDVERVCVDGDAWDDPIQQRKEQAE